MFVFTRKIALLLGLFSLAVLAGCSSTSSSTATYAGPTVSVAVDKRAKARAERKEAKADLRKARRDLKKLERSIARNEKRLKRKKLSDKRKAQYSKDLKADKRKLRKAKRSVRKAERALARAERREKRATKAIATAKRRKVDAERRLAEAERRKRIAEARKQLERKGETQTASARSRLFGLGDPSLKFIDDYGARVDGGFPVAAIPVKQVDKRLYRQSVSYRTRHKPGTIVVDTSARYLYLVQSGNRAMRYGIGVGRAGFSWSGEAHIGWKQKWPKWTPPEEMIARKPSLAKYCADCGGMPGGPANPLGARALYLMKDGKDTLYRLHGTPQWQSIGTAASSGCIRLMNQDIIDLYQRVPTGTKVVVI